MKIESIGVSHFLSAPQARKSSPFHALGLKTLQPTIPNEKITGGCGRHFQFQNTKPTSNGGVRNKGKKRSRRNYLQIARLDTLFRQDTLRILRGCPQETAGPPTQHQSAPLDRGDSSRGAGRNQAQRPVSLDSLDKTRHHNCLVHEICKYPPYRDFLVAFFFVVLTLLSQCASHKNLSAFVSCEPDMGYHPPTYSGRLRHFRCCLHKTLRDNM